MITIISCGMTVSPPPIGDLNFDCRAMPDPSPVVHDLPGKHPIVLQILLQSNPMVAGVLEFLTEATHRLRASKKNVTLVIMCSAGWHRSVAVADEVARRLSQLHPDDVTVFHRDLQGAEP